MATAESAKLLNLQDQIGTLEIGHKADLVLIQMIRAKRIVNGL